MKRIFCVIIVLLLVPVLMAAFSQRLQVTHWTLTSEKLSQDARFALLTDLHNSFYGKNQEELIAAIDQSAPDAVLMAGDMADNAQTTAGLRTLLKGLANRYPVYYVSGNHECANDEDLSAIKTELRSLGVIVLEGESTLLREDVRIAGADDPLCLTPSQWRTQIDSCRSGSDVFTLLLSHRPDRTNFYDEGFDRTVCGHAHGGQVRLFGRGLWAPNQGFFPEYTSGFYRIGEGTMFVSRGLAKGPLPRFLNRPELAIITIEAE